MGLLYLALPKSLSAGPRWLATTVVFVLVIISMVTHHRENIRANHFVGHLLSGVLTLFLVWSLVLLVRALPVHAERPVQLLKSALALWVTNVIVFALWYWRLDAGGPNGRDQRMGHESGAFLFPQMTAEGREAWEQSGEGGMWSPNFVDYLFLAFNTSTAFSPTDSPVLSRWAKVLTMAQSSISLTVVVILAGRAVNIM